MREENYVFFSHTHVERVGGCCLSADLSMTNIQVHTMYLLFVYTFVYTCTLGSPQTCSKLLSKRNTFSSLFQPFCFLGSWISLQHSVLGYTSEVGNGQNLWNCASLQQILLKDPVKMENYIFWVPFGPPQSWSGPSRGGISKKWKKLKKMFLVQGGRKTVTILRYHLSWV